MELQWQDHRGGSGAAAAVYYGGIDQQAWEERRMCGLRWDGDHALGPVPEAVRGHLREGDEEETEAA